MVEIKEFVFLVYRNVAKKIFKLTHLQAQMAFVAFLLYLKVAVKSLYSSKISAGDQLSFSQ